MKRILIIDDEKDFCSLIKVNLELTNAYKVLIANSGREGVQLAEQEKPDLILLDIIMPNMDGFQVIKTLKENPKTLSIPIIMLTAVLDEKAKQKAWEMYDEAYLTKPVETETLKAKIEEVLKRFV